MIYFVVYIQIVNFGGFGKLTIYGLKLHSSRIIDKALFLMT